MSEEALERIYLEVRDEVKYIESQKVTPSYICIILAIITLLIFSISINFEYDGNVWPMGSSIDSLPRRT